MLTEGPAIVQYLADQAPERQLAPPCGTLERARLQEWLNFIGTELHKNFGPLFNPAGPDDAKAGAREILARRLPVAAQALSAHPYLMGERFSVADAYLFTVLRWTKFVDVDLGPWPSLNAYIERMNARPAVQAALEAEAQK